jgi:hypothetical protein
LVEVEFLLEVQVLEGVVLEDVVLVVVLVVVGVWQVEVALLGVEEQGLRLLVD